MTNNLVGTWQIFEREIIHPNHYLDPYLDVTLVTEFRSPDGNKKVFWGFFDGGASWKIRFMPDCPGKWTYRAAFSDGSLTLSGEFECIESNIPGPLEVNPSNPQWFRHKSGKAFFIRSFHVGDCFFSANLPEEKRTNFLNWAQKQGYNTLSIASHYLNRNEPGRGLGYDTPRLWPLNAREYQRAEVILNELAKRQIVVFPFAGFFGRASNYPTAISEQEAYIRYILARFGPYWNVLFNVAGPEPLLVKKPFMAREEVNRLGRWISSLDVFHHPITVHNQTGDDQFIDQDWLTFTTLQGPKTLDLKVLSEGIVRNTHPKRPMYAQETLWSGNKYHPNYSDDQLRKNAYVIHFCAGFFNFIDNGKPEPEFVGDSSAGFSGSLDLKDCCQWRHDIVRTVWDTLQSLNISGMRPVSGVVQDGNYCLAEENQRYLIYMPASGTIQLLLPDGNFRGEWIHPLHPDIKIDAGKITSQMEKITPENGDDWLLLVNREN